MNSDKISATILVKDTPRYLKEVASALSAFGEVAVYGNGASGEALAILRQFPNVTLHQGPFLGFGPSHNRISSLAKHDWIFSIDSDEVATPELIAEINRLSLDPNAVYTVPRKNFFNGKWIRGCGWYPDKVKRLYNKTKTAFSEDQVHESVRAKKTIALQHPLIHYSYDSISDFLNKMQSYSTLFAKQNAGKKSSTLKALLHGWGAFLKSYLLKRGFLDGSEGFIISMYNGHTAFYKYLKLAEGCAGGPTKREDAAARQTQSTHSR